jgi:hypothetical protein
MEKDHHRHHPGGLAEALLELFLTDGDEADAVVDVLRLGGGEEAQGVAGVLVVLAISSARN